MYPSEEVAAIMMANNNNPDEDLIEPEDDPIPVAVAVRLKGGSSKKPQKSCLILNKNGTELSLAGPSTAQEKFKFDHILTEDTDQGQVYAKSLQPFVPLIFDGFDLFVIVYGGADSGKSYTLFGPNSGPLRSESELGLIPRLIRDLFQYFVETEMTVKASSFDVTNDDIRDLLAAANEGNL
jgi:hypothetical protein